jgi:predicted ATP-grasp superfamily ATP-dependent carboligase
MPLPSRVNSSEALLIAAPSGRALARAARDAGYEPLVVDFFDDLDTRALASANRQVEGDRNFCFEESALLAALDSLAAGRRIAGLIYGGGFEDRIDLLQAMARRWPLIGNAPEVVAEVKDPIRLAEICAGLGIPHPEMSFEVPAEAAAWLVKHAGGSGGAHIASAQTTALASGDYYQRGVPGSPVSALLLADGSEAIILGFSQQWTSPAPGQLWRYGGAARPAALSSIVEAKLKAAALAVTQATHLAGLNSVDFLVYGEAFHLLEINPRPGATLDIFHDDRGRLLRAHVAACAGHLPEEPLLFDGAEAACFVYAPQAIAAMPALDWPLWTGDRQKPSSVLAENDPICTVLAQAPDLTQALHLLEERRTQILTLLSDSSLIKDAAA